MLVGIINYIVILSSNSGAEDATKYIPIALCTMITGALLGLGYLLCESLSRKSKQKKAEKQKMERRKKLYENGQLLNSNIQDVKIKKVSENGMQGDLPKIDFDPAPDTMSPSYMINEPSTKEVEAKVDTPSTVVKPEQRQTPTPMNGAPSSTPMGNQGMQRPMNGAPSSTPMGNQGMQRPINGAPFGTPMGNQGMQRPMNGAPSSMPMGNQGMQRPMNGAPSSMSMGNQGTPKNLNITGVASPMGTQNMANTSNFNAPGHITMNAVQNNVNNNTEEIDEEINIKDIVNKTKTEVEEQKRNEKVKNESNEEKQLQTKKDNNINTTEIAKENIEKMIKEIHDKTVERQRQNEDAQHDENDNEEEQNNKNFTMNKLDMQTSAARHSHIDKKEKNSDKNKMSPEKQPDVKKENNNNSKNDSAKINDNSLKEKRKETKETKKENIVKKEEFIQPDESLLYNKDKGFSFSSLANLSNEKTEVSLEQKKDEKEINEINKSVVLDKKIEENNIQKKETELTKNNSKNNLSNNNSKQENKVSESTPENKEVLDKIQVLFGAISDSDIIVDEKEKIDVKKENKVSKDVEKEKRNVILKTSKDVEKNAEEIQIDNKVPNDSKQEEYDKKQNVIDKKALSETFDIINNETPKKSKEVKIVSSVDIKKISDYRKIIVVLSPEDCGKTTVAVNMAYEFANKGVSTVLIDTDNVKKDVYYHLNIDKIGCLSRFNEFDTDSELYELGIKVRDNLTVFTENKGVEYEINYNKLYKLINYAHDKNEVVIIDLKRGLGQEKTKELLKLATNIMIVLDKRVTSIYRMGERLARIRGALLNKKIDIVLNMDVGQRGVTKNTIKNMLRKLEFIENGQRKSYKIDILEIFFLAYDYKSVLLGLNEQMPAVTVRDNRLISDIKKIVIYYSNN